MEPITAVLFTGAPDECEEIPAECLTPETIAEILSDPACQVHPGDYILSNGVVCTPRGS